MSLLLSKNKKEVKTDLTSFEIVTKSQFEKLLIFQLSLQGLTNFKIDII